ncbi:CHASE3 domain-containing protein [Cognatilysobacter bugurensis]|uniref:histidine kinase n=1 Tax=Cognatilysobacter bugurensis TaxID=543356 RepID=A0A918T3L9_9GAMM|nr:CHASE3 domain-containing protein [Lysobacter bugurensis]GHA87565.1 hypothetical protein GCM10007067_26930 [Lysobacter bugurensis]
MPLRSSHLPTLGIVLAFVLLALLGVQAKRTQDALLNANARVADRLELLSALQGTLSSLQDVETGMRGFLLTGDEVFLEPYHRGRVRLVRERSELHSRLAPTPEHAAFLSTLDQAVVRRLALAEGNVAFRRTGTLEESAERARLTAGKQAMDRVRALLGALERAERTQLVAEEQAVTRQLESGRRLAIAGGLTAIVLLLSALVAVNRNFALRARLTARAQAGEARQRAMLQAVPDTLWLVDEAGVMHALSSPGAGRATALPPALADAVRAQAPSLPGNDELRTFNWNDTDGHEYEVRLVRIPDEGALAIVRDVTEAMRNRRDILDRRAFLRSIVDTDENLIFVRDPEGRFVLANLALCDLLHLDPAQVEGTHADALEARAVIAPLLEGDAALVAGEAEWRQLQVRVVDLRGHEMWLQLVKRPLELSDGRRQVLTVAVDVTARLRVERMKNEFISTVSHELRTPLTSIRGALGMLGSGIAGPVPDDARPLLDIAHKNTERLVRLINDILDIEKLESGRLQMQLRPWPVRGLIEQAIAQNRPYAVEFGVEVVFASAADESTEVADDITVDVDADRFAQVMANLLSNAAKHSPPGGTVEVELVRAHGGVRVAVIDRGEGIPESFRAHVFERFAQADGSDVRRRGGTGLGLAITRSLVEQMHGTIGFESELGHGTRFEVWLPVSRAVALDRADDAVGDPTQPHLVLVEDDAATAAELTEMLARNGFGTRVATTPAQARRLLVEPGVRGLALDLALAGDSAPAFLRELRAQSRYRHLPVLLLGVQPPAGGRGGLRGGTVGVVDWLAKPLDPERVAAAVRACLHGARARPDVLHVEDDADLRELVRTLLAGEALTLHSAADLAQARRELAQRHHDLVILDLMLPDGDGAELLPELGAARPPTPVIIFSAQDAPLPDSRVVLRRLVKSRSDAAELAALIKTNLEHWPVSQHAGKETQ